MLYPGRSISCADKTNAKSPPLRRDAGQIAPAQWPVGNVLFPTRLRCTLFAKFCFRSLKVASFCKARILGLLFRLERDAVGNAGEDAWPMPLAAWSANLGKPLEMAPEMSLKKPIKDPREEEKKTQKRSFTYKRERL